MLLLELITFVSHECNKVLCLNNNYIELVFSEKYKGHIYLRHFTILTPPYSSFEVPSLASVD